jgi:NAD(P)-dependent dehydrogenase (short-subunit alcohol dehydrogenase family)
VILSALFSAAEGMRVLITGGSQGIGLGLARHLLALPEITTVISTSRRRSEEQTKLLEQTSDKGRLLLLDLDVTEKTSHEELSRQLREAGVDSIDVLILNHGISNPDHPVDPVLSSTEEDMMNCYKTNVVGTLLCLQSLNDLVLASQIKLVAVLSSKMGSIKETLDGIAGCTSYSTSKAALNMLIAKYVQDPRVKCAGVRALLLHPGHVSTSLGSSKGRLAPVTVDQSCAGLVKCILAGAAVQRGVKPDTIGFEDLEERLLDVNLSFVTYSLTLPYPSAKILPF